MSLLKEIKQLRMLLILVLFSINGIIYTQTGSKTEMLKNSNKSLDKKVNEIISQLTLEEKIALTIGDGRYLPIDQTILKESAEGIYEPNKKAKLLIPRLSIWKFTHVNGPSGVNKGNPPKDDKDFTYTTAFPSATLLAATWDTELVTEVGKVTGNEVLEYDYGLSKMPGLNIHRNPKCGRNFEYYSEDPLLTGKMTVAMVNGLQSNGIGAVLKHFVANNQESNRRTYNAVISQRALREIYLRGFEIAIKEGKPASIMTSYNKLNGFYTPELPALLQDIARHEWGFDGLYMTDFDMRYGDAVAQVKAGTNLIMTGKKREYEELKFALKNKTIDESTLDENLFYNIKLKLNAPRMNGFKPSFKPDLKAHAKVARNSAADGMVLLKNENNTLPIKGKKTVAVFGKTSYDLILSGTGSGTVDSYKYKVNINEGLKSAGFKVLKSLENNYTQYIAKLKRENIVPPYFDNPKMRKDNGIKGNQAPSHFKTRLVAFSVEQEIPITDIKKYESKSDFAVITLGRSAGENYENGYLPLSKIEQDLVKNVSNVFHEKGKKVIVILNVGGVWETASWRDYADAILLAWQPGQEGGNAIADIMTGAVNPSGKLPDSFPIKYEDVPSSSTFPGVPIDDPVNSFYKEGIYVGYRYYDSFDVPTAYEFGYGLSYTTFKYSNLKLSSNNFDSKMEVVITIKNSGKVAGREVVQLYLSAPTMQIEKPVQELKGFGKTKLLQPGESQELSFELDERSLASFWSGISSWIADKGDYEVRIAASSKDIRAKAMFNLSNDIVVEKVHDVLYPNFFMEELSRLK
jgi:beta-glucosidase